MLRLQVEGVCKYSGKRPAVLNQISLALPAGEIFALIGTNGAGKTTLIKAILDLVAIDRGRIFLGGRPHRETAARRGVAYLPEQFRPPHYLRGGDFLRGVARLAAVPVDADHIGSLCAALELEHSMLATTIGHYSKGTGQKLGLIASLLCGERLLLLDEPMSGLDVRARILLRSHLEALRETGRSIFLSTHLLTDVAHLCDRIAVIDGGHLLFVGTPRSFCDDYGAASVEQAYMSCLQRTAAYRPAP